MDLTLETFLPYRLSVLANTVSTTLARAYGERFGLAIPDWRVLAILGPDGARTAGEIAQAAAMDKVAVSRAVARLVTRGLVRRTDDATDRRARRLALTPAGIRLRAEIVPLALAYEHRLIAGLDGPARATLDRLLAELQAAAAPL